MKIAFLHTAVVHVETFNTLLNHRSDIELVHQVKPEWLSRATSEGLTADLRDQVTRCLEALAREVDTVICTCSSLGPIAQDMNVNHVFRIDAPMMVEAVKLNPVLLVMCLESTVAASSELLELAFTQQQLAPRYRTLLCNLAWPHFERGETEAFGQEIAAAVMKDIRQHGEPGCVVLAQVSMRAAVQHLDGVGVPVLTSPELAVAQALAG